MTQEQFETKLHELGLIRHKPDGNYVFRDGEDSIFSDGCLSNNIEYCFDGIFRFYPEDIDEHEYNNIIAAFTKHNGWSLV